MTYRCVIGSRNQLIICPAVDLQDGRVLGIQAFGKHAWKEAEGDCCCCCCCCQSWRGNHLVDLRNRVSPFTDTCSSSRTWQLSWWCRYNRGTVVWLILYFVVYCKLSNCNCHVTLRLEASGCSRCDAANPTNL